LPVSSKTSPSPAKPKNCSSLVQSGD